MFTPICKRHRWRKTWCIFSFFTIDLNADSEKYILHMEMLAFDQWWSPILPTCKDKRKKVKGPMEKFVWSQELTCMCTLAVPPHHTGNSTYQEQLQQQHQQKQHVLLGLWFPGAWDTAGAPSFCDCCLLRISATLVLDWLEEERKYKVWKNYNKDKLPVLQEA